MVVGIPHQAASSEAASWGAQRAGYDRPRAPWTRCLAAVRHYCEQRVPPHALHQVRSELVLTRGSVTIVERRAPWREDYGPEWTSRSVARLRYTATSGAWTLYWSDRNGRWRRYDLIEPTPDVRVLLDEVDRDPTGIFWG